MENLCVGLCMCGIHYLFLDRIAATTALPTACFFGLVHPEVAGSSMAGFFFNIPATHTMQC